jgi:hypothetical protein
MKLTERKRTLKGFTAVRGLLVLTLSLLVGSGCGGNGTPDGQGAGSEDLPPAAQPMSAAVQGLVDQGNTAQREGLYAEAMEFYQEAMELDSEHPIPQFGALMAALALGDSATASSLSASLELSAPDLLGMLNTDGGMGEAMPADPHGGAGAGMPGMPGAVIPAQGELPSGHSSVVPDPIQPDTVGQG